MSHRSKTALLSGMKFLVTGGATGLGAAISRTLHAHGAGICILHLPGQEEVAAPIVDQLGEDCFTVAADVSDRNSCEASAHSVMERWGRLDGLINNAGVNKPARHDDLDQLDRAEFERVFAVNLIGAYEMTRALLPHLRKSADATIVNISSASGETGYGSSIAYAASKGALNTMTKSLARALAPDVRVNAVCPGFVDTSLWDKLGMSEADRQALREAVAAQTPLGTAATPEQIAGSVLFLSSPLSANVTGQLLTSDGGYVLGLYDAPLNQAIRSD